MKCPLVIVAQQHCDNGRFVLVFGQRSSRSHEALTAFDRQFVVVAQAGILDTRFLHKKIEAGEDECPVSINCVPGLCRCNDKLS
jgi:hypothetical protein